MNRFIAIVLSFILSPISLAAPTTQPSKLDQTDAAAAAAAKAGLDRVVPGINFTGVTFQDAIEFIRDVTGANIFVNWRAIETAGIDRNSPVNMKLRNVKLSRVLSLVLTEASSNKSTLNWQLDDGVIMISTVEDLGRRTIIRVYDIRDLLDPQQIDKKGTILMNLVMGAVAPDSWIESGGKAGTCKFLDGHLIITQTRDSHTAIENLLAQLREFQK
jgi:hypothetical protein